MLAMKRIGRVLQSMLQAKQSCAVSLTLPLSCRIHLVSTWQAPLVYEVPYRQDVNAHARLTCQRAHAKLRSFVLTLLILHIALLRPAVLQHATCNSYLPLCGLVLLGRSLTKIWASLLAKRLTVLHFVRRSLCCFVYLYYKVYLLGVNLFLTF